MDDIDWNRQLDDLSLAVERHRRRSIQRVATNITDATTSVTLGCGHTMTFNLADHALIGISQFTLAVGFEMDCDQCVSPQ